MGNKAKRIAHRGISSEAPENTTKTACMLYRMTIIYRECACRMGLSRR